MYHWLGEIRAVNKGAPAIRAPYPENADQNWNRLDDMLFRVWGHVATHLMSGPERRRLERFVERVEVFEPELKAMSDRRLRETADDLRRRLRSKSSTQEETSRAFALAREVVRRNAGVFHFPVQLMGGAALMCGALIEMQTGEGKTLTAVLPAVTAALAGRPVHIVTVNDYLARRDADALRPAYEAIGLSVGIIEHGQSHEERERAYNCDITYCTNKELVFDYLRDQISLGRRRSQVQRLLDELFDASAFHRSRSLLLRGLHFAIIDEADSVLIDEARTPLILSGPSGNPVDGAEAYETALDLARKMIPGQDFRFAETERTVRLTEAGEARAAERARGLGGLWQIRRAREEFIRQALAALHLFRRDSQYIVLNGTVQIVDEYTGRIMPDRSWEHGLHQMIEAKENCAITERKKTLARITYQRFFRRYRHLCGMTGTAIEACGEMQSVYRLRVVPIPTNRPLRRHDMGTRLLPSAEQKWRAVAAAATRESKRGRAVLIGTRSVEASERVSALLVESGLKPSVLNARQHRREAAIITDAGQPGRITVATNMAGRGTDIRLHRTVKSAGGLHVILTEYHESRRIDRQLFGRAGRQGDPGSHESIVSLEDEIFRKFGWMILVRLVRHVLLQGAVVPNVMIRMLRAHSQSVAERVHARERLQSLEQDDRLHRMLGFSGNG